MEGDVEDVTIIKELFGGVTIVGSPVTKKPGSPYAKTSSKVRKLNAETNTGNIGSRYATQNVHVPPYATYRAQVNLTPVKPTLQECGYINAMSKDTRYFAQTLRKYPLPKPQTKSSDLIQEKIKRGESKSANKKTAKKKRSIRKTTSQQAIKSNAVFECTVQDKQRLSKVEEILPTTTKVEGTSGNEVIDPNYNYLNAKPNLNTDVRYCTSTKRTCTCRRIKNVVCTRPENCPNVQHRLDHHRQFYHENKDDGKKPSCHCNVCQASREATSTSQLQHEQEDEVQLLSRNYSESSHDAINFEKEIEHWTQTKLKNDKVVQIKLIQKLAKALGGLSSDKGFVPEARHEVVKYLTALSVIDPSIKDKLDYLADDLLNNLWTSIKKTKSSKNVDLSNLENSSQYPNEEDKLKIFLKHFLSQLPIEKDKKNNEHLDAIVEKFVNILQEHNIKQIDLNDSSSKYEEKDYYLNRILSWYNSMPELEQKLELTIYDNIKHFQDLAYKLTEINKSKELKENIDDVKAEIMQWLKDYLTLHNVSHTESLQENLNEKLVNKIVSSTEERFYKGLSEKDWITENIYSLLKSVNNEPFYQNNDVLALINSFVIHLSYIKEKNNGNITLHQCEGELRSWFEYLETKFNVSFDGNEKVELEYKILSRIKIVLKHEKHAKNFHLKRLRLLTKIILEEISKSVIDNSMNISPEKLLNLITDVISLVFETYINEKLISKTVYEKVCTILHTILNLPADEIKHLVKTMLDKITLTWKNVAESHLKENDKFEAQPDYPTKKTYKSQFATSTPRQSDAGFSSSHGVDFRNGDSTGFSHLIDENMLHQIIKDWLEEHHLNLTNIDKQKAIKCITKDIVCRYNYARAFSKTITDMEEIEYLKYYIFKVLGDYLKEPEMNNIISNVSKLHDTINKTLTSAEISMEPGESDKSRVSLEVLKNNLINAFINLNTYLLDEKLQNEYKGKLKDEINNFCSQYFGRFPASPLDTNQLHSNVFDALDNVPKPPLTKSETDIVTQINIWLDELRNTYNLPNNENENNVLDLVNPLLQKKKSKTVLHHLDDELSQTISQWLQNYTLKQKKSINNQYWTNKLLERLKELHSFEEPNLSKGTSAHMYTIPTAKSFVEDDNRILAEDLLTNEDRELLSRIKDRTSIAKPDSIVKSQTDFADGEMVSPNVCVREYNWESSEQIKNSLNNLLPDDLDDLPPGCVQAKGLDHKARTKFVDIFPKRNSVERDVNGPMIPERLNMPKGKRKPCKLRKRSMARRSIEPSRVVCPNKFTVKSKSFDKDVPCSCSDCVINKHRIKYFCKRSENTDLQNCPQCLGGYCPFPSCAYFE